MLFNFFFERSKMMSKKVSNSFTGIVSERLKFREKFAYGLGDVASNIVWGGVSGFATYYYTNAIGMAAAAIGTMFLLSKIFDGISDIIFGLLLDRTNTKYGKARPWLLWMAIPYGILAYLMFSVPSSWGPIPKLAFAYVTYNLLSTVIYTAINLSYGTMTALVTDDDRDRTSLNVYRMVGAIICSVVINIIIMPMVNGFGGDSSAWSKTFAILGATATVLFILTFAGTKERVGAGLSANRETAVPVKVALKALIQNKYWVNRMIANVIGQLSAATMGINIYFAAYWLGSEEAVGLLTIISSLPMFISLIVSSPLVNKFGKRNISLVGAAVGMLGLIVQAINPASYSLIMIGQVLRGIGLGPIAAVGFVMIADAIEYGEWKTGVRSEGLVYSASSFGAKVGAGLGAAILGWALAFGGYNAEATVQSHSAMTSIIVVFIYIPMILQVITIVLLWVYKLDKELPSIREELAAKHLKENSTNL